MSDYLKEFDGKDVEKALDEAMAIARRQLAGSKGFALLAVANHGDDPAALMHMAGGTITARNMAELLTSALQFAERIAKGTTIIQPGRSASAPPAGRSGPGNSRNQPQLTNNQGD